MRFILPVLLLCCAFRSAPGREMLDYSDHCIFISAVAFLPDGRHVLAGDTQGHLTLWNVENGRLISQFSMKSSFPINGIAVSQDGKRAIVSSLNRNLSFDTLSQGEIVLWELPSGRAIHTLDDMKGAHGLAMAPDGKHSLTADGKVLRLWDTAQGKLLKAFRKAGGDAFRAAFLPDGKRVIFDGNDGLSIFDLERGTTKQVLRLPDGTGILAVTPDAAKVFLGRGDDLHVFAVGQNKLHTLIRGESPFPGQAAVPHPSHLHGLVAVSAAGDRVATSGVQTSAFLWDAKSGKRLQTFARAAGGSEVRALALSPDGKLVVTGESCHTLRVWDAATGRQLLRLLTPRRDQRKR